MYEVDEDRVDPQPEILLLRSGAHFKAVERLLQARFPGRPVPGLLIARVVPPLEAP